MGGINGKHHVAAPHKGEDIRERQVLPLSALQERGHFVEQRLVAGVHCCALEGL